MEDQYERFLDADQEPRRMLQPIEGYQKMPLVTLDEAVESIIFSCPDIRRRVYIAMSNCGNPSEGLNQNESASIYLYTMEWEPREECLYYVLNKTLRTENRNKLKPWFSYLKLILTALYKLRCEKNVIWRGVKCDLNQEYEVGKRYVWWAFSSCTLSLAVLEDDHFLGKDGPRTLFNIECQNGKMIRDHSYFRFENETLLLPATQFEVKSKLTLSSDVHIIHLKEVDPPFPLIEPPSTISSAKSESDLKEKLQVPTASSLSTSSFKSKIKLKEKCQGSATSLLTTSSIKPKLPLEETYETSTIPISTIATLHPTFHFQKKKEPANNYQNEKLEQLIAQGSLNGRAKFEQQELTDIDIPYIVQRVIIDQKCSDLNISWNKITDIGAEHLGQVLKSITSLQRLDMSGNRLSNRGTRWIVEALHINTTLATLDLSRNQIDSEGARYLAEALHVNLALKDVCLYTNLIGDGGAQHLARALTSNETLTLLNIGRNGITDQGIIYLADMLKRNSTLTHFYIGENPVTNHGLKIIMNALCYNQELKWLGIECAEITRACVEHIRNMFERNSTLTGLCLPKASFSNQDQERLQAMVKIKQNCGIWFL